MTYRLGVLSSHPVQYHAPWFRALSVHSQINLKVFFCHMATPQEHAAAGFGVEFDWDAALLAGYEYRFLENLAATPTIGSFRGLDTPEVAEIIRSENFDAVIVNGWNYKSAWQAMRACWQTNTPVLARSDSHLLTERTLSRKLAKWPFYNWFIPKLDACLPVGKWSREYFLHYGARPEKVFIVPHAVDEGYFTCESERWSPKRAELRAEWLIDQQATVFLFAGKFIDIKRPMDFVWAVDRAAKAGANLCGLMIGDGPLRSECQAFVDAHDTPIKFAGFLNQSEIAKGYVASDALVLPSQHETWGIVVNEAMSCGRPCFVSKGVGCEPDLIVLGETGQTFPKGDIDALAALMVFYAQNPDHLRVMGAKAARLMTSCSIEGAVAGTVRALDAVSSGRNN